MGVYLGSRDLIQFWEISALSLVNRRFRTKRANYCKFHIIETVLFFSRRRPGPVDKSKLCIDFNQI